MLINWAVRPLTPSRRSTTSLTVLLVKFRLVDVAGSLSEKAVSYTHLALQTKTIVKLSENISDANRVKSLEYACPVGTEGVVHRSSVGAPLPEILNPFSNPVDELVILTV